MLLTLLISLLLAAPQDGLQPPEPTWSVRSARMVGQGSLVEARVDWEVDGGGIPATVAYVYAPYLVSGSKEFALRPVAVYGQKAAKRALTDPASGNPDEQAVSSLSRGGSFTLTDHLKYEPALDSVRLVVKTYKWSRRKLEFLDQETVAWLGKPEEPPLPRFPWNLREPREAQSDTRVVERFFPLMVPNGGATFEPTLSPNAEALDAMEVFVKPFTAGRRFTIRKAEAIGLVAPSGNASQAAKNSQALSQVVLNALRRKGVFKYSSLTRVAGGENWDGVRDWVSSSIFSEDEKLGSVLVSLSGDPLYERLRDGFPSAFEVMESSCFPLVSGVLVRFTVKTPSYDTPALVQPVAAEAPDALSAHDWWTLAVSYPIGGEGYVDALLEGARRFPEEPALSFGAAMSLISKGSLDLAAGFMRNLDEESSEMLYARAAWLFAGERVDESYEVLRTLKGKGSFYETVWNMDAPWFDWHYNLVEWNQLTREGWVIRSSGAGD